MGRASKTQCSECGHHNGQHEPTCGGEHLVIRIQYRGKEVVLMHTPEMFLDVMTDGARGEAIKDFIKSVVKAYQEARKK